MESCSCSPQQFSTSDKGADVSVTQGAQPVLNASTCHPQRVQARSRDALLERLRALGLAGTIRLKLLKIGAVALRNTRRIQLLLRGSYPYQRLFGQVVQAIGQRLKPAECCPGTLKNNEGWGHSVQDSKNPPCRPLISPNPTQTAPQNLSARQCEMVGLVYAKGLPSLLWDKSSRPSLRWL